MICEVRGVSVTTPVARYLKELPASAKRCTVHHKTMMQRQAVVIALAASRGGMAASYSH